MKNFFKIVFSRALQTASRPTPEPCFRDSRPLLSNLKSICEKLQISAQNQRFFPYYCLKFHVFLSHPEINTLFNWLNCSILLYSIYTLLLCPSYPLWPGHRAAHPTDHQSTLRRCPIASFWTCVPIVWQPEDPGRPVLWNPRGPDGRFNWSLRLRKNHYAKDD